jgi:hypothetical protein
MRAEGVTQDVHAQMRDARHTFRSADCLDHPIPREHRAILKAQHAIRTKVMVFQHSYLTTEERFRLLKDFEGRNLIVPGVGDLPNRKLFEPSAGI